MRGGTKGGKLPIHGGPYVDKTETAHAFKEEFEKHPTIFKYTEGGTRPSAQSLAMETVAAAGTDHCFYICGPSAWMNEMQAELLKLGAKKVMCERPLARSSPPAAPSRLLARRPPPAAPLQRSLPDSLWLRRYQSPARGGSAAGRGGVVSGLDRERVRRGMARRRGGERRRDGLATTPRPSDDGFVLTVKAGEECGLWSPTFYQGSTALFSKRKWVDSSNNKIVTAARATASACPLQARPRPSPSPSGLQTRARALCSGTPHSRRRTSSRTYSRSDT